MYISDDENEFLNFPLELYKNDPYCSNSKNIENCKKLFVLKDNEITKARAALIYNKDLNYKNYKTALVGFFESIDDTKAVNFLFDEIKKYALSKGFEYLIAPIDGSTFRKYRITENLNNPPFLGDNYHKPYYEKLFSSLNFEIIAKYSSTIFKKLNQDYSRLEKFSKIFEEKGLKIRSFDRENFYSDIKKIYEITIKSFTRNFLYTPVNFSDFYKMYEPYKKILNENWVLIAEDENDNPIAFIFAYNNLFSMEKSLVIKTLAQIPNTKFKGIGSYLVELLHKKASLEGYQNIIHALMKEDNVSRNILKGEIYQKYNLYGVKL